MPETKTCPKCGAELSVDAPAGICPKCLMQAGLASEQEAGSAPGMNPTTLTSGFVPPEPEDLAKHFPQLEILELLGKGGMGAVYKARQPGLDRLVAVKILPPEISRDPAFAERFQREARALARLSHPHIVAVYDFDVVAQASLCYIVMEFVNGANLRQAIRTGKLTSAEALAIVPQICEALQFAHDEGIVHRDIKPENILIDKRGRVKIADFGLAKLLGQDSSDHSLTATHQVMGTLRYMAPEQMQGSREVDHRADIYSLGVVFYELLTGELPMGRFAPPSKKVQVDVRLDEIVLRALEQQPEQRYQNASEIKTDVEHVTSRPAGATAISGSVSESPTITSENRPERPSRVEAVTAVAVSIAFVLAAVNGMFELAQSQSPLNLLAVFVTGLATTATAALLVVHQIRPPSRSREALPVFFIALLSMCAGSLPWTAENVPITGWRFWEGAEYAALSFALSLLLLVVGSSHAGTRAIATILVGLIGFGLVMWFHAGPVCLINGPMIIQKSDLPGMFLAAVLSVLATIAGALQLRRRVSASHNAEGRRTVEPASPSRGTPLSRTEARAQESLPYLLGWLINWLLRERWFVAILQTASAILYVVCLIAFFSFHSSNSHTADGLFTRFDVGQPTAWLTLESSTSGQHVRFEFITLTHVVALIGLASLTVYRWLERRHSGKAHSMNWHYVIWIVILVSATAFGMKILADTAHRRMTLMTSTNQFQALPPLGTITSGIGATFTVPAGQVATFEIVTRRNNETVSVPPHCGYVMAPPDSPIAGTFRWSPTSGDVIGNGARQWGLEFVTSGGGSGYNEAVLLPEELNDAVGARSLGLGVLEPNEETIHWGIHDVRDLPANGLIGLRVTVVAHGMESGGSGNGHIDWKKAQSAQSTTRRKLPVVAL